MFVTLSLIAIAMLVALWVLAKVLHYPRNICVLFFTSPLLACIGPTVTFIGGLLATKIAPSEKLATLPLTLMIVGTALGTIIVSQLNQRLGRKQATNIGYGLALIGCLLAMFSAVQGWFYLLLLATLFMGFSIAFSLQLRFAAIESVASTQSASAVSVLMLSGIFAAILGPEMALFSKDWIASEHGYAGSFLGLAILISISFAGFQLFSNPIVQDSQQQHSMAGRNLSQIIKQPSFIIALGSGAIGYGLMSFVMTATPLSMHDMMGHSLADTKWVIQSHIAAMFLPSFFTGLLIKKFHTGTVMATGTIMYALVIIVALSGQHVMHYWWALVLLGVGWNFLFTIGTVILPESYQSHERYKAQALNDFVIFFTQALASLLAGWLLFTSSWDYVVLTMLPFVLLMSLICAWHIKRRMQPLKTERMGDQARD
ncbi:MFS transporter [Thalassotalea maritima]|uniref:MFS transporter n=1 Tax=Thalassotalea maritima TaxID=3242416 RepID=UPI003529C7FF